MAMTARIGAGQGLPGWRSMLWGAVAALLLLPLVAMQFTREVAWTGGDFAVAALLLGGAAALFEGAVRLFRSAGARAVAGAVILAALLLVWAQLAVGII